MSVVTGVLKGSSNKGVEREKESLEILMRLVNSRVDMWISRVATQSLDDKRVQVDKFIASDVHLYANCGNKTEIGAKVQDIVKGFSDGDYAKSIANTLGLALSALIASQCGSQAERESYTLVAGSAGAVLRVDYFMFCRKIEVKGLISSLQNVSAVAYYVSSCKSHSMDISTVNALVELSYPWFQPIQKFNLAYIIMCSYQDSEKVEKDELLKTVRDAKARDEDDGRSLVRMNKPAREFQEEDVYTVQETDRDGNTIETIMARPGKTTNRSASRHLYGENYNRGPIDQHEGLEMSTFVRDSSGNPGTASRQGYKPDPAMIKFGEGVYPGTASNQGHQPDPAMKKYYTGLETPQQVEHRYNEYDHPSSSIMRTSVPVRTSVMKPPTKAETELIEGISSRLHPERHHHNVYNPIQRPY